MNKIISLTSLPSKIKGTAILLTVLLLLIMATLVTLYTGKIQSFEHRIALNEQNQKWANATAKAGLETSLASLAVHKTWLMAQVDGELADNSPFLVNGESQLLADGRQLVTLTASGRSSDGLASAEVSEQALIYPLLTNVPPSPLTIKHGFSDAGEFEIVLNPDGLGDALPLSLWSDSPIIVLDTQSHSCFLVDFNLGNCQTTAYSSNGDKKNDIADNSANFPTDILSYLFNVPGDQWQHLRELADFNLADCSALDIASWGFIWIEGDCEVSASTQVATQSQPVVLLVLNGQIILHQDVNIYGLILSFKSADFDSPMGISMQTNALVQGGVVANYQLGEGGAVIRVVFNGPVAEQLKQNKKLQRVARVPGSWRDF